MAAVNIAVNIPQNPHFNVGKFKHQVEDYAAMLVVLMTNEETSKEHVVSEMEHAEALAFIQSLAVKGGENVPFKVSPLNCLIEEKYER